MSTSPPLDPEEFRRTQREAWDSVASGWNSWWEVFDRGASRLNEVLVARAGVAPGHRVLDVATGEGEPALTAARRVGPTGSVLATDLSPRMLEFAARRAAAAGLQNLEFREVDAQELELEPASFDAAVSRWGLMLVLEPSRVLERVLAALRPGAAFAAAVWCEPARAPFLATPMRIAREVLEVEPPAPDAPGPFRLAEEGALDTLFSEAGFEDVAHEAVEVPMQFPSLDAYRQFVSELSSSMRRLLAEAPEAARERVWERIGEEAAPHLAADGSLRFVNESWCVAGRHPVG